jgi:hypothetical protein
MNTFNEETDYSGFNDYNIAPSDSQGPEQKVVLMDVGENSRHHSNAGREGDSATTAFLRSKKNQSTLSVPQHTHSTFDTFAPEDQEWEDDDEDVLDEESLVSLFDINDIKNDVIPLSSYNDDAVDEALKWTEAFMDHDNDSDEESSIEEAPLHDSMSSFNETFEKLTKCMERSALARQLLTRQLPTQCSEKSLGSSTSSLDISQRSFHHHDSLELLDPLAGPNSSHSSTGSGLVRPRIKKAQKNITRSGLIRRHSSHPRGLSGQDITKRGLVKKDSLTSLNGSLNGISLNGNSSWGNLSRSSSFRKTKLSPETLRNLLDTPSNLSLRVKARLSQNVNKRRMMDQQQQHFVFGLAAPRGLEPKPTNNDISQSSM